MGGRYKQNQSAGSAGTARRRAGLRPLLAAALAGATLLAAMPGAQARSERPLFVPVGEQTRAPIGWVEFCTEYKAECHARTAAPRDVVLSAKAWADLLQVNAWVNNAVKPVTDLDHWGVVERWSYPDDGKGDCEDYVLLKRRMLIEAGWPREALLVTVVREKNGDGHAVLTVKTNKGEYILDNQEADVKLWSETSYRFIKRQSQADQNVWVSLSDPQLRNLPATASAR